ncbi:MAG: alpha/beta fold hydrolase [Burkholderiales bacterium]|nr:alpha/beta fold hydrolase [Burkholderiales bacterium]
MLKLTVLVVLLVYGGLCLVLYLAQDSLLYFPQPRANTGAPTIRLATADAQVLVTTRPREGADAMLYFGGNAEDVSQSLPGLAAAFAEHALYLMHYRGYGGSTGEPSEAALFADALALFDQVRASHPNIVVVGRSLGSGVAVYLASQRSVARLVLVTPYDSIVQLAADRIPYFPVRWLLRDKFDSARHAAQVNAPTLLIAAERDEVIPRASTEALLTRFRSGLAEMRVVPGAGHNTIDHSPEYGRLLKGPP